ncbi:MAG: hypothetical protein PHS74_00250 [Lachnospiraceae bacterium]|nr:hypothetical protein [Lachnospiraceae bacterium]
MLKETITYNDYNGVSITEDFYFNLNQAEIVEMQMSTEGGFAERINRIIAAHNEPELIKIFKDLVLQAYGEKSDDNKTFVKINDAGVPVSRRFSQTEAYSQLFMKLATNTEAAIKFINGIIPADAAKELEKNKELQLLASATN